MRRQRRRNPSGTGNNYITRWDNGTYHLWSPYSRRYLSKRGFKTMSEAEKALGAIYRKGGRGAFRGPVSGKRVLVNPGKMALAYTFPNGFAKEAESMYAWLRHEGLSPTFKYGRDKRRYVTLKIMIPRSELARLKYLKKSHPARYGFAARGYARNPRRGRAYRRVKFN